MRDQLASRALPEIASIEVMTELVSTAKACIWLMKFGNLPRGQRQRISDYLQQIKLRILHLYSCPTAKTQREQLSDQDYTQVLGYHRHRGWYAWGTANSLGSWRLLRGSPFDRETMLAYNNYCVGLIDKVASVIDTLSLDVDQVELFNKLRSGDFSTEELSAFLQLHHNNLECLSPFFTAPHAFNKFYEKIAATKKIALATCYLQKIIGIDIKNIFSTFLALNKFKKIDELRILISLLNIIGSMKI